MDYRRNEDKLCNRDRPLGYNALLDIQIYEADDVTEPATLAEAKSHLRVDFTDDDAYITMLIKSCRAALEKFTGLSLVEKTITATINNARGGYELPYGPVIDVSGMRDSNDAAITSDDYTLSGIDHKRIDTPASGFVKVEYLTGYFDSIPVDLRLEILKMVAFEYENRGDVVEPYKFSQKARAHRRVPKIL